MVSLGRSLWKVRGALLQREGRPPQEPHCQEGRSKTPDEEGSLSSLMQSNLFMFPLLVFFVL